MPGACQSRDPARPQAGLSNTWGLPPARRARSPAARTTSITVILSEQSESKDLN